MRPSLWWWQSMLHQPSLVPIRKVSASLTNGNQCSSTLWDVALFLSRLWRPKLVTHSVPIEGRVAGCPRPQDVPMASLLPGELPSSRLMGKEGAAAPAPQQRPPKRPPSRQQWPYGPGNSPLTWMSRMPASIAASATAKGGLGSTSEKAARRVSAAAIGNSAGPAEGKHVTAQQSLVGRQGGAAQSASQAPRMSQDVRAERGLPMPAARSFAVSHWQAKASTIGGPQLSQDVRAEAPLPAPRAAAAAAAHSMPLPECMDSTAAQRMPAGGPGQRNFRAGPLGQQGLPPTAEQSVPPATTQALSTVAPSAAAEGRRRAAARVESAAVPDTADVTTAAPHAAAAGARPPRLPGSLFSRALAAISQAPDKPEDRKRALLHDSKSLRSSPLANSMLAAKPLAEAPLGGSGNADAAHRPGHRSMMPPTTAGAELVHGAAKQPAQSVVDGRHTQPLHPTAAQQVMAKPKHPPAAAAAPAATQPATLLAARKKASATPAAAAASPVGGQQQLRMQWLPVAAEVVAVPEQRAASPAPTTARGDSLPAENAEALPRFGRPKLCPLVFGSFETDAGERSLLAYSC